ncbi:MAG: hypothetical protein H6551_09650 [Chitinophagales bacterium]|nr:hypothetical protein [Chitinophagaceae bacterium]MCB9065388.1 hypothetical protein [Chitinophagales bacterium]
MNYKRVVQILSIVFLVGLVINTTYYRYHPNQMTLDPTRLSVINEATHEIALFDKESDKGVEIINKMYGPYTEYILNHNILLSTPTVAEFTLPQFEHNDIAYILREHPSLRYNLWRHESPDVILLGSSIFFCDFNREAFFKRHAQEYLLDFTTGNNTPYVARYFMQYADSLKLSFKPGTIVLYGMNRVEMLEDYKDKDSHQYVKDVIEGKGIDKSIGNILASALRLPELRHDVTTSLKNKYDETFRGKNIYRKEVDEKYLVDENAFADYMRSIAPTTSVKSTFAKERIQEIALLNNYLAEKGCKLVVLNLPQSLYNDIALNTEGKSYFETEMKKLSSLYIDCVDASDFKSYNISQLDYIWPVNIFDPEHLNVKGAKRFTESLMNNLLDSLLFQQTILN